MKKTYLFLCLTMVFGIGSASAQVAPPTANLKHQWTFDDGTAKDYVGGLDGTLVGNATVVNKALNTANGGYVNLDATALAINTYTELTVETWFTSVATANGSYHMLFYFGDTNSGGGGINYTCITPARGNNVSRAMISTGTNGSTAENGVNSTEYDDGILHHMVEVISATSITFYVDGSNQGTADLTNGNSLAGLGTQFAYFAKGGYRADPTWKGSIHKISVYDKALTDENIIYMYQHGAEEQPVISSSVANISLDNTASDQTVTINAANLNSPITITAPANIMVKPTTLPANTTSAEISVSYIGTASVTGNITLTSGSTVATIPVRAESDAACYVPLYTDFTNLITDAGCNTLKYFSGWGTREIMTLAANPENVYCGASSIKVGDGVNGGSGSLDFHFSGQSSLAPNTTYKIKVMAKTDGPFQLGVERVDLDNASNNTILKSINTNNEWQPIELVFSTGARVGDDQVIYLNDWSLTGKVGYFDNWEMYAVPDQVITTTAKNIVLDDQMQSTSFNVTGANLEGEIVITAPAGITVIPSTLPASAASEPVLVSFDGTTPSNGLITLTSGTATISIPVKTATNTCYTPLYSDRQNLIPDPYVNESSNFRGWKGWKVVSIVDYPDSIYCGSHCARIFGDGDIEVPLTDKLMPAYTYVAKAMVKTKGYFQMGIAGWDKAGGSDVTDSIDTNGEWQAMTFEFHTADSMRVTPVLFFNNYQRTGKFAYLDNWELYAKEPWTAVPVVKDMFNNVYVKNGKIVAEFDVNNATEVQFTVYNVQGAILSTEKMTAYNGRNSKVLKAQLPSGMYIVKMSKEGASSFRKIVK